MVKHYIISLNFHVIDNEIEYMQWSQVRSQQESTPSHYKALPLNLYTSGSR